MQFKILNSTICLALRRYFTHSDHFFFPSILTSSLFSIQSLKREEKNEHCTRSLKTLIRKLVLLHTGMIWSKSLNLGLSVLISKLRSLLCRITSPF